MRGSFSVQRDPSAFVEVHPADAADLGLVAGQVAELTSRRGVLRLPVRIGRFDPFPFSLLNVLVSLEAIFLTSFVLMTQNRMTHQADKRAHLDLQVNLLAEQELTAILQMIYALCQQAGTCARVTDKRIEQLLKETDIVKLAVALEKELPSPQ